MESCDDGNRIAGDGCNAYCQIASVCGDGAVTMDEQCDPGPSPTEGCDEDCRALPGYVCTGSPSSCSWDGSGLDPNAECRDLPAADAHALCGWVDDLMTQATEDLACVDWLAGACDDPALVLADSYCDITVHEYEACWHEAASSPCGSVVWADGHPVLSTTCWIEACKQPTGSLCLSSEHCDDAQCCGTDGTIQPGECRPSCEPSPLGAICFGDHWCASSNCCGAAPGVAGTCAAQGECLRPLGEPCGQDWQCESDVCIGAPGDGKRCRACVPSAKECSGDIATICSADGLAFVQGPIDCSSTNAACVDGQCLPIVCEPNAHTCKDGIDGDVWACDATGTASSVSDDCVASQHCVQNGAAAACVADVCVASQPSCDGDVATMCNADGTGFELGGTDCATTPNHVCSGGQCLPVICDPFTFYCQNNSVYFCNSSNGVSSTLSDACAANEYCENATCKLQLCAPGSPVCNGDLLTSCNAQGSGYLPGGTDCAAQGLACTKWGCATVSIDVVGAIDNDASSNSIGGNIYAVTATRMLIEAGQYMSVATPTTLAWAVYKASSASGPYAKVAQWYRDEAPGSKFFNTGPIQYVLEAGSYYAVVVGPAVVGVGTDVKLDYTDWMFHPQSMSFGQSISGFSSFSLPATYNYFYDGRVFHQRLTVAQY